MPHLIDLSTNILYEGNNGDRWQVVENMQDQDEMYVKLKKMKVEEQLIPENEI